MNAVDLRTILADPDHSGAYFIDVRDTEAMAQTAAALDFAVMRVDLSGCDDKAGLMTRLAKAGGFPTVSARTGTRCRTCCATCPGARRQVTCG